MRLPARAAATAIAVGFLALHLPFLPASLEDLDSINFALGLRHYDIAQHQPHPPGYPVFITLGHLAGYFTPSAAHALALLGIVAGALGVIALFAFCLQVERLVAGPPASASADGSNTAVTVAVVGPDSWIAWAAALVAATSPLYWFTAARPLSDVTGLSAAVAVQAWALAASTSRSFAGAAFFAGAAVGIRSQVAWLTVPVLILAAYRRQAPGAGRDEAPAFRRLVMSSWFWLWPFAIGCLVWAVPMVIVTGGPAAYWRALFSQGSEDLTGIQMLWTMPTPRVFVSALYYAFVAPWALWSIAVVVVVFATLGAALMFRFWPRALATLAAAYVPYLAFDLLFQETFTTRYALPLVVPAAYLAVRGAAAFGWRAGLSVAIALSLFDAHIGGTSIAAYAREKAPAFRLLDDMAAAAPPAAPVLAMDRREQLDLRRPFAWIGSRRIHVVERLSSPPQHEWLEPVKYWNGGGRNAVWFVADPLRADVEQVQHGDPIRYRWAVPYPVLLGGVRPNEMDWYRIERPGWYVGNGWSLTPEAAGVSRADHLGLATGPIDAWADHRVLGGAALIGGRNLDPSGRPTRVTVVAENDGGWRWFDLNVGPGAFLQLITLPPAGASPPDYLHLVVRATPPETVAIEQFDVGGPIAGFGTGWQEQEYNPATGKRWRWLSERGELRVKNPHGSALALHVEGESPRTYFSRASRLTIRIGSSVLFDDELSSDFSFTVLVPPALTIEKASLPPRDREGVPISFETDQVYVPAERSSRTQDRRHLGLRIFDCSVRPARP